MFVQMMCNILWIVILVGGCSAPDGSQDGGSEQRTETDWPIFRGDNRLSGYADEKLAEQMTLLWSFQTEDDITSSPVINAGTLYIGSEDGFIYALKASNGKMIWKFDTGSSVEAPPLVLNDVVYVGSLDGIFYALAAESGRLNWKFETESRISGSANWFRENENYRLIFGCYDSQLYCLDANDGSLLWTFETESYINGAPAVIGEKIIFGGCDAFLRIVAFDSKENGKVEIGSYMAASPATEDDIAYLGQYENQFMAIDLEAKSIRWRYSGGEDGDAFFSSPAITAEYVVVGGRDEKVHCINKKDGAVVWTFVTRGSIDSSPLICRDRVLAGSQDGRLYMLNLNDGALLWSYEIGEDITGSPAVVNGKVYIGAEDGRIYAFGEQQ